MISTQDAAMPMEFEGLFHLPQSLELPRSQSMSDVTQWISCANETSFLGSFPVLFPQLSMEHNTSPPLGQVFH